MKLRSIYEDFDEYAGFDDTDQFGIPHDLIALLKFRNWAWGRLPYIHGEPQLNSFNDFLNIISDMYGEEEVSQALLSWKTQSELTHEDLDLIYKIVEDEPRLKKWWGKIAKMPERLSPSYGKIHEEAGKRQVIRRTAETLSDILDYLNESGEKSEELIAIDRFLQDPTPQSWNDTKWIINSLISQVAKDDNDRAQKWAELNNLTSPTIVSSIYDMDQKYARKISSKIVPLSKAKRDKLKKTLGPLGYITSLSSIGGDVKPNDIKKYFKRMTRDGEELIKAAETDLPNLVGKRQYKKF